MRVFFTCTLLCFFTNIYSNSLNSSSNDADSTRQKFIDLLGEMPSRDNIKTKTLSSEKFDKFQRKLIQYEILGDTIEAYLLIPNDIKGKVPGILAIHQDGAQRPYKYGKSEPSGLGGDTSLFYGLELCLKGNVVICPDRFGFESRMLNKSRFWKDYKSFLVSLDYYGEKTDLTEDLYKGAKTTNYLLENKTSMGVTIAELMYAIDILYKTNEVDTSKIAVIGHSAGGLLAGILMYVDKRIDVGCSSCGSFLITDMFNNNYLRPMNGFAGLLTIPGIKKWGDFDDVIAGIYPKPFIELSADIDRSKTFEKALLKQKNGKEKNRIKCIFYNAGKHTFRKDMRELAYNWIASWF